MLNIFPFSGYAIIQLPDLISFLHKGTKKMIGTRKMRRNNQIQSEDLRSNTLNDSISSSAEKSCDIKVIIDLFQRVKNLEEVNKRILAKLD